MPAIAQSTESDKSAADDLQLPEAEPSEASPEDEGGDIEDAEGRTLNLPDFEPRLPGETAPEQSGSDEATESEEATDPNESPDEASEEDPDWTEGEVESSEEEPPKISKQQQILITADEHYLAGDYATAEALYRQVKDNLWQVDPADLRPEPIFDPADLPPAGAVYWREAQAGYEQGLTHRTTVPLELLAEDYPEFIPGQVFYANYLVEQGRAEEADAMLDSALLVYPSQPDLLKARTHTQMALEQWIEASITARQFILLNPEHADYEEMATLSQENLDRFRAAMNEEITGNFIGNLVTGAAGALLTGGLIGPYTALNSAMLLLQGESAVGATTAEQVKVQAPMMSDRQVDEYLDTMGQELASLAGRDEFDYDFYVIDDPELNAFALPGGKIFINAGAILKTNSEAELAGLLSHELSHTVLSHGFQMATNGNLVNSIASIFPVGQVGGIAAGLAFSSYSRQMERQADVLGTQILATAGYAADGLHNLMVTLEEETGDRSGLQWFASHPAPTERVEYLRQIVEAGGYNRYAYEGVATHLAIQQRVARLMDELPDEAGDEPTETEDPDATREETDPANEDIMPDASEAEEANSEDTVPDVSVEERDEAVGTDSE
ncbi:MAG: M48 family metalloprotease [Cyanobacteria bacterium J06607_6]